MSGDVHVRFCERVGVRFPCSTRLSTKEVKRFPPLRRMWQPVGQQRAVDVPSNNEDFAFYGVVDVLEGRIYTERYPKEISEHTISFLESVLDRTTGRVLLIWDQARWHASGRVTDWIEKQVRLEVLLLPLRSPETNPVEDLWREMKRAVAACLERSLDRLEETYLQFLDRQTQTTFSGLLDCLQFRFFHRPT